MAVELTSPLMAAGYNSVSPALLGAGTGSAETVALASYPNESANQMTDARTTPSARQQANPYGVGVNVDYMA